MSSWTRVPSFTITSGTRNYVVRVGYPVSVRGEGREGGVQPGWQVISIEQHEDGRVNVEVKHIKKGKLNRSRIFRSEKIVYVRPPKVES